MGHTTDIMTITEFKLQKHRDEPRSQSGQALPGTKVYTRLEPNNLQVRRIKQ